LSASFWIYSSLDLRSGRWRFGYTVTQSSALQERTVAKYPLPVLFAHFVGDACP
jgi:hypothetical protein